MLGVESLSYFADRAMWEKVHFVPVTLALQCVSPINTTEMKGRFRIAFTADDKREIRVSVSLKCEYIDKNSAKQFWPFMIKENYSILLRNRTT